MQLFLAILIPFFGAMLVVLLSRYGRTLAAWTTAGTTALALATLAPSILDSFAGATTLHHLRWIPAAGLNLSFRMDGLGLLF